LFNPLITENRTEAEPALKSLPTIEQQWVGLLKNQVTVSSPDNSSTEGNWALKVRYLNF
jgi:hypothetical protein